MSRIGLQLQAASPACGKTTTVTLGARGFILRAPLEPCRPSGAPLPLMVLIHCFGCDAAAEIRIMEPGKAYTMDYRSERLNIKVDEQRMITDITCG